MVILSMAWVIGCGGGDGGTVVNPGITPYPTTPVPNPTTPNPQEQQIITQVSTIADSALSSISNDPNAFQNAVSQIRSIQGVKNAGVSSDRTLLFAEYEFGGIDTWLNNPLETFPAYMPDPNSSNRNNPIITNEYVDGDKAIIINSLYIDPAMDLRILSLTGFPGLNSGMKGLLESYGYRGINSSNSIDYLSGTTYPFGIRVGEATIEAFKNLDKYSFIFILAHGGVIEKKDGASDDLVLIQTAQIVKNEQEERENYQDDIKNKRIIKSTMKIGLILPVKVWHVTDKFFEHYYLSANKKFPHSIFFAGCCDTLKITKLADTLNKAGVAAYIGWNNPTTKASSTGYALVANMVNGNNLQTAMNLLPYEAKNCPEHNSSLIYYPPSASSIQLKPLSTQRINISLSSPTGNSTNSRVISVSGSILTDDLSSIIGGTLTVNDISTSFTIDSLGNFSQDVGIKSGTNKISLMVWSNKFGGVSKSFTMTGNFSQSDLWTELRWDDDYTDVDLHLLSPGSTLSDLFTSKDCYFKNISTSWGAYLDVDDRNGRGPEHITMPTASSGRYTLVVHYYSDWGKYLKPNAEVFVSSKNGNIIKFGTRLLSNPSSHTTDGNGSNKGDRWQVCYIDFPSGTITPVNTLTTSELEGLRSKSVTKE